MEKYDENYKADWIITVTSSEANGTAVYNLYGSIDDVTRTVMRCNNQSTPVDISLYNLSDNTEPLIQLIYLSRHFANSSNEDSTGQYFISVSVDIFRTDST